MIINLVKPAFAAGFDIETQYSFAGGKFNTLGGALGILIVPAFSIAATAVVIYFIIGAIRYLISAGDKNATSEARGMITHAIIGFILLMMMFLFFQFLPEFFGLDGFKIVL